MARKSLGTLTLDIVARTGGFIQGMDKAERSSAKWRKQVEKDMKVVKDRTVSALTAGAAAATAFAAATAALTKEGMSAVPSQARLAKSLDTTYDSVTQLRAAFGDSGIDDFEASMNRLNRRLGAAELGRGAALNAVKELKLDLQELAQVDAAERVAIIADRIKDVATNSQTAARYAQDLGFEQREAAAFFLQGGDAVRAYREQVEALGLSLSDIDAQKVIDAQKAMGIFGDLTTAVSQRLAVEFSPILRQVAQDLEDTAKETGGFSDEIAELVDTTVTAVAFVASAVDATGRVFNTLGKTIAVMVLYANKEIYGFADSIYNGPIDAMNELIEVANRVPGVNIAPRELSKTGQHIKDQIAVIEGAILEGQKDIQDGLLEPLAGERIKKYFEDAKAAAEDAVKSAGKLRGLAGGGAPGDAPKGSKTVDAIANEITALERAAKTWGMAADEVKLYGLEVQGATEAQLGRARAALEEVAAMEKAKDQQEAYLRLVKDLRTDEERLSDQFHERIAILDAVAESASIAADEYARMASRAAEAAFSDAPSFSGLAPEIGGPFAELDKIDEAQSQLQEWYDTQLQMLEQFREERSDLNAQWDEREAELHQEHQDRLAEIERARQMAQLAAGEEFFGSMAGAAKVFFGENSKLYRAAFALEKSYAISKALMNVPKSYSDAFSAVVGIPIVGPALAPAAGVAAAAAQVAQAAAIGNINMTGMAHDGIDSVPKTGTWLLEKGERVTTAETSAKLDATLDRVARGQGGSGGVVVNLIEDSARAGQVDQRDDPSSDQGKIIDVFVSNIQSDGRAAQAIQNKWGLSARGR